MLNEPGEKSRESILMMLIRTFHTRSIRQNDFLALWPKKQVRFAGGKADL
jgi:hypothetical protein